MANPQTFEFQVREMIDTQIQRINLASFVISLLSIAAAALVGVLGIWGVITTNDAVLWKLLGTCGTIFAAAVLTNLAIGCYTRY